MTWLITGGAGYIGAHVVGEFLRDGEEVVVYDSLVHGLIARIPNQCKFIQSDIRDIDSLERAIRENSIKGIIHLAGLKSVNESIRNPKLYREINELATKSLLEIAVSFGVERFIFSSTAAVYGDTNLGIVSEEVSPEPISPYGESKFAAENLLNREIGSNKITGTSLRYFNVIGAANKTLLDNSRENLIPILLAKIHENERPEIFGTDYPTNDGTCIRDYVDVNDVARAHLLAAKKDTLLPSKINIGTGLGHSVRDVINTVALAMNLDIEPIERPRREGDAAMLVANVDLARKIMQFESQVLFDDSISSMIQ